MQDVVSEINTADHADPYVDLPGFDRPRFETRRGGRLMLLLSPETLQCGPALSDDRKSRWTDELKQSFLFPRNLSCGSEVNLALACAMLRPRCNHAVMVVNPSCRDQTRLSGWRSHSIDRDVGTCGMLADRLCIFGFA